MMVMGSRRSAALLAALAILAGAPVLGAGAASAQPAPARPAPAAAPAPAAVPVASAAQMTLARELVDMNGEARTFDGILPSIVDGAARFFLQTNPDLLKPLTDAANAVRPQFEKRQSELLDLLAGIYATRFSEAELKDAIAFYRTSVGQKLVSERPAIFQQAMRSIQAWGAAVNAEAVEALRAEMKKRGHDL